MDIDGVGSAGAGLEVIVPIDAMGLEVSILLPEFEMGFVPQPVKTKINAVVTANEPR